MSEQISELQQIVTQQGKRLQALEDQWQRLATVFFAAPTPQPKLATTQQKDGTICPKCGKQKKSGYDVCYTCWEKRK